jgi:hypothetical protein
MKLENNYSFPWRRKKLSNANIIKGAQNVTKKQNRENNRKALSVVLKMKPAKYANGI